MLSGYNGQRVFVQSGASYAQVEKVLGNTY